MSKKIGGRAMLRILMALAVCLFCVCGHVQNEIRKKTEMKPEVETEVRNQPEVKVKEETEIKIEEEAVKDGAVKDGKAEIKETEQDSIVFSEDSDVLGILTEEGRFPQQIKTVCLENYREGKYETLLQLLRDSQVETIRVTRDWEAEAFQGFWLDDVAGISTLRELELDGVPIRVQDAMSLKECGLKRIEAYIDRKTDWRFLDTIPVLEELACSVIEEMDLSPLLGREELSLYLDFERRSESFEKSDYWGIYIVCPEFNREVGWQGEAGNERFPAIYQCSYDQGRMVECFTERHVCESEDKIEGIYTEPYEPWIRVTDGAAVYELRPGEGESEGYDFGDVREDRIRFQDINFDGVNDIVLEAGRFGAQGSRGEFGYLWNQKTGRYEFSATYTEIANPVTDTEHQIVRSAWRNSAQCHSWAIYRFENGEFMRQGMLTEELLTEDEIPEELEAPEEAGVIRWQEEIYENGEVAEIKNAYAVQIAGEETVYPEECRHYCEEDSYWAVPYWSHFEAE